MTILRRQRFFHSAAAIALSFLTFASTVSAMDTEQPDEPPTPPPSTGIVPPLGLASQHRCVHGVANQIDRMQQWSGGNPPQQKYDNPFGGKILPGSFDHALGVRPEGKIHNWRYTKTRENTGPVKDTFLGRIWVDGGNNHFQGIARYSDNPWSQFFVWSGADWHTGAEGGAHLFFASMEGRSNDPNEAMTGGADGRSATNLRPDPEYGWDMPPTWDKVFHRIDLDNSTMHPDGSITFWHAGGMQAYNGLLAVALENGGFNIGGGEGHNKGKIVFVNVQEPWTPKQMSPLSEIPSPEGKIGAVALTKNRAQHWVLAAWQDRKIWLYISRLAGGPEAIEGGWKSVGSWAEAGGWDRTRLPAPGSIDDSAGYYQNINFINGCDGTFYIAGMNNSNLAGTGAFGDDWLDLYALYPVNDGVPNRYYFRKIWKKHFVMDGDHASFMMGSGIYASPAGKLMMYATGGYQQTRMNGAKWISFREFVAP